MKRRQVLAGLGGVTAVISGLTGTGAFTSVAADRNVDVAVTGDNDAALVLSQLGAGERSQEDGSPEQVEFSFPSAEEQVAGLGLGANSVYEFDRDAEESSQTTPQEGLLRIKNQGSQPVTVYSELKTPSELEIEIYDVTDPDRTALRDDPAELSVGDSVDVGFRIRTFGADAVEHKETLTIVAEDPN